jgi:hypothetical protein
MYPKKISSPLSSFNNILLQITKDIEQIYLGNIETNPNMDFVNNLLFEEKSITIFGQIKILLKNDKINFKFCGEFRDFCFIEKTTANKQQLEYFFQQYIFLIDSLTKNFDNSVSYKFIENVYNEIVSNVNPQKIFLVPIKDKIKRYYDSNDSTLDNLYNRYSYVVKFIKQPNNRLIRYKLLRVLSSELDQVKSIDNIRFEDIDTIKDGNLSTERLPKFLEELFYYGELIN